MTRRSIAATLIAAALGLPTLGAATNDQPVTGVAAPACDGDCNGDGRVVIAELVRAVAIALGLLPVGDCNAADRNSDINVSVGELVGAVANALGTCAFRPTPTPIPMQTGTFEIDLDYGGLRRRALITVPAELDDIDTALVVAVHGVLSTPELFNASTDLPSLAESEGFILVTPRGYKGSWNAGVCCDPASAADIDDVGFVRELVSLLMRSMPIDTKRIYATGFSNGAAMVHRLAIEAADLFAAVAPVGGALAQAAIETARPLPILIINNIDDPIVPFFLGQAALANWRLLNDCGDSSVIDEPTESTTCESIDGCADSVPTILCGVRETSHVWPGGALDPDGTFDANPVIWDFLDRHQLD